MILYFNIDGGLNLFGRYNNQIVSDTPNAVHSHCSGSGLVAVGLGIDSPGQPDNALDGLDTDLHRFQAVVAQQFSFDLGSNFCVIKCLSAFRALVGELVFQFIDGFAKLFTGITRELVNFFSSFFSRSWFIASTQPVNRPGFGGGRFV